MSIEWKECAVCYADGQQWFASGENHLISSCGRCGCNYEHAAYSDDFQLSEPMTGYYLPKSELDTEQKYNDAVEVLGLFGFEFDPAKAEHPSDFNTIITNSTGCHLYVSELGFLRIGDLFNSGRKLTYNQLIAIGKLKSLMNERKSSAVSKVNLDIERAVKSTINAELDNHVTISANKYDREISDRQGNSAIVDVYDVLKAFEVTCPATQHAVKKLLCSGIRGHKDLSTDLIEAKESIVRAIELNG